MKRIDDRMPLNILHVASHDAIRAGGSVQMMRLALGLHERGHRVVCVFNDRGTITDTFAPLLTAGIPVYRFPMQKLKKYYGMLRFRQFVKGQGFDVIHAHRFRALRFVLAATRGMTIPALVGDRKNSFPIPPSWARLYGSSRVDCIVVNARIIQELLVATGKVPPEKIALIYNGVDLDQFHPGVDGSAVRKELGIGTDTPLVGMIANFAGKKSHSVFFDAALRVLQVMPETHFLLVGGGDSEPWQRRLATQGRAGHFTFTGFRTDVPQIIASLQVSVISSAAGEGLTGSIVESMAMAKPVVSTAIAGNAEFVRDRETGMLVP
ncbi:MAG: glycosyltransferase, partial [Desulfobacterota bacterium]|nr:glycosyltransferase [Thermodesulfobacteriota bacterium]